MLVPVSRYLRHYVTYVTVCGHGSWQRCCAAVVVWCCGGVVLSVAVDWLHLLAAAWRHRAGDQWPVPVVTLRWCRPLATGHPATSSTPSFRPALPLPALCLPCQEMVVTYTPLDKGTLDYCCGEQTHQWSQWSTCQNFSIYLPPPEMNHVKPFESCWFSFASIVLCRYIVNGCVDIICEELNLWTAEWEIIRKSDARTALATVTHPVTVAGPHLPSLHLLSWVSWYLGTGSVSCLNNLQYHYQISGTCNCTTRQATIMAYLIY